ncbi:MAG: hypothetical protein AAGE01_09610 [Pseudomonadota bacterium]
MALWLPEPASAEPFGWLVFAAIFGVVIYRSVSKAKRPIGAAKASPAAWEAAATAEALPPPKITQKIGRLGKLTRNNPAAFMVVVIAAFAGVGLAISLVIILGLLAFALVFN